MKPIDYARVDLGAAHNGRVTWRNVFAAADGSRFIVDRGRRVPVLLLSKQMAHVNYVTVSK